MINDFSTLKTAVAQWLARSDLDAQIPNFIQLAEARMSTQIRVRQMDAVQSGVLANYMAALPTDFLEARAVIITAGGVEQSLEPLSVPEGYNKTFGSLPRNYRIGSTSLQTYGGQGTEAYALHYTAKIPALSDQQTQNWLILYQPNVYLYATLLEAATYLRDDARTALWGQGYSNALAAMNTAENRARFRNARIRPAGPVNP